MSSSTSPSAPFGCPSGALDAPSTPTVVTVGGSESPIVAQEASRSASVKPPPSSRIASVCPVPSVRAGNLYVNRGTTGALVGRQAFGGSALSGVGSKAGGPDYLRQFVDPRVVTENTLRQGFAPQDV